MEVSEHILLRRFVDNRDSEAFSEIVKRYADPVYNTCRRILFDEAGAADASQETFYQLMCSAGSIRGSLAGWLHSVATKKAIEAIRRNSARRLRERRYTFNRSKEVNPWREISPSIDQELEKLPPQHKDILMRYFFEGKKMDEIAAIDGVSQPTVSRRINAAVEALRKRFQKKGILASTIILASLIEHGTLHAAPAVLLTETSKMSLAGMTSGLLASSTSAGSASAAAGSCSLSVFSAGTVKMGASALFSGIKANVAAAAVIAVLGTGGVIAYNHVFTSGQNTGSQENAETIVDVKQMTGDVPKSDLISHQPIVLNQMSMGAGGYGARVADAESDELPINLIDPEMTIDTFTDLLVTNNRDRWADCFVSDAQALADLKRIMNNPQNSAEQQLQTAFNSIGHPVEILDLFEVENGFMMTFLCTVYNPFSIDDGSEKRLWKEGDQFEINAKLVCIDQQWKLVNLFASFPPPTLFTNQ